MQIGLYLPVWAAVFAGQLWLCFRGKTAAGKRMPGIVFGVLQGACLIFVLFSEKLERRLGEWVFYASFAAAVYSMLLWGILAAEGLAWAVYGIAGFVQKRRK